MPEIKSGFSRGKMNKDLDERLIANGEYRDAMNIQVSTSESSDVGVVQNILGNAHIPPAIPVDDYSSLQCVGAVENESTDSVYWLIHSYRNQEFNNIDEDISSWISRDDFLLASTDLIDIDNIEPEYPVIQNIRTDTIAELSKGGAVSPVVVDNYQFDVHLDFTNLAGGLLNNSGIQSFIINDVPAEQVTYFKFGMEIQLWGFYDDGVPVYINTLENKNVKIKDLGLTPVAIQSNVNGVSVVKNFAEIEVFFSNLNLTYNDLFNPAGIAFTPVGFRFVSKKVLNFKRNNLITGLNIIDDYLYWTDNETEPKKINIPFCKEGTHTFTTPTRLIVPQRDIDYSSAIHLQEKHVTVLRPSPLNPLHAKVQATNEKNNKFLLATGTGTTMRFINSSGSLLQPGDTKWLTLVNQAETPLDLDRGDILILKTLDSSSTSNTFPIKNPDVRVVFNNFSSTVPNAGGVGVLININVTIQGINPDMSIATGVSLAGQKEEKEENLFKDKFVRFAYRWRYRDGEYSTFSPFTNPIFNPGIYNFTPTTGYNLGMENTAYDITLQDFITPDMPENVVEVDLLFKDSVSPQIYIVDTVSYKDNPTPLGKNHWNSFGSVNDLSFTDTVIPVNESLIKGSYEIKSETIFKILPNDDIVRTFDDVPRKALSQEMTANRIIYGNYVKDYDLITTPSSEPFDFRCSRFTVNDYTSENLFQNIGSPSLKTMREYQLGIVYRDTYGRETPVFTAFEAAYRHPKIASEFNSRLVVQPGKHPSNKEIEYYKFYIKETSNEYYNLVVDRVYNAEDGNVWISFPSADRNKIDEDTYLSLKKGSQSGSSIDSNKKYKVLAISNDAPSFIKTRKKLLGTIPIHNETVHFPATNNKDFTFNQQGSNATPGSELFPRTPCDFNSSSVNLEAVTSLTVSLNNFTSSLTTKSQDGFATINFGEASFNNIDPSKFLGTSIFRLRFVDNVTADTSKFYKILSVIPGTMTFDMNEAEGFFGREGGPLRYNIELEEPIQKDVGSSNNSLGHFIMEPPGVATYNSTFDDGQHLSVSTANQNTMAAKGLGSYKCDANGFPECSIELWDYKEINKPEFSGRFFVKIEADIDVINEILNSLGEDEVLATNNLFYISTNFDTLTTDFTIASGLTFPGGSSVNNDLDTSSHWLDFATQNNTTVATGRWFIDEAYYYAKAKKSTSSGIYSPHLDTTPSISVSHHADTLDFGLSYRTSAYSPNTTNQVDTSSVTITDVTVSGSTRKLISGHKNHGIRGATTYSSHLPASVIANTPLKDAVSSIDISFSYIDNNDFSIPSQSAFTSKLVAGSFVKFTNSTKRFQIVAVARCEFVNVNFDTTNNLHSTVIQKNEQRRVTYRLHLNDDIGTESAAILSPSTNVPDVAEDSATLQIISAFQETFPEQKELSRSPAVFETEPKEDVGLDIYYEVDKNYPLRFTEENAQLIVPIGSELLLTTGPLSTISIVSSGAGNASVSPPVPGVDQDGSKKMIVTKVEGDKITISNINNSGGLVLFDNNVVTFKHPNTGCLMVLDVAEDTTNTSTIRFEPGENGARELNWFNCFSFNNGVESDRIRDTFNLPRIDKGVKVSTVIENSYGEQRLSSGLIFSGIYNGKNSINNLNQFISSLGITKDLDPNYGSIQKLYTRDSDLIALCEDKIIQILADKDAIFNADGNPQLVATNRVLGQSRPFAGDYGISKNPESFAKENFRAYFTDKQRGAVLRLSRDGLTDIAEAGMKDWFKDHIPLANSTQANSNGVYENMPGLIGSYDGKKDEYNITLRLQNTEKYTLSFKENVKGWTSFKSFIPETGVSVSNEYYTFKNGQIFKHHIPNTYNTFYNTGPIRTDSESKDSSITFIFNDEPSVIKSFNTLNYEGTQGKVITNTNPNSGYYNITGKRGWFAKEIITDQDEGSVKEFIDKENKWFNWIRGEVKTAVQPGDSIKIESDIFNYQGIGKATSQQGPVASYKLTIKDLNDTD